MKDIEIVLENKEQAHVLLAAFQTVLDNSTDMLFIKDIDLTYLGASMPFVKITGKQTVEDVIGHTDAEIFGDPDLARRYVADDLNILRSGENLIGITEPLPEVDGLPHYGSTSKYILRDREGTPIGLLGVTRDITREIMARQSHRKELDYLFALPSDTYAAILLDINDWRIISDRKQTVQNYELPSYNTIDELVDGVTRAIPADHAAHAFYRGFTPSYFQEVYDSGKRKLSIEYPHNMADGTQRWAHCELTLMMDPDNNHLCVMLVVRDIDFQKQFERKIRQAAEMDSLTGLLNRAATMRQIEDFLQNDGADDVHALMIIDVDNFKDINDTYGHRAGDQYLARFAKALRNCFRTSDIVGRLGGDEFFVLMKNVSSYTATKERADALLKAMHAAGTFTGNPDISGSIGICFYRGDGTGLDALYDAADQAMYQAKRNGKNRVEFAET